MAIDLDVGKSIVIKPPLSLDDAPTAYTFGRRRILADGELPWAEIFNEPSPPSGPDPRQLQKYFEDKWGLTETDNSEENRRNLFDGMPTRARELYVSDRPDWPTSFVPPFEGKLLACLPRLETATFTLENPDGTPIKPGDKPKSVRRGVLKLPRQSATAPDPLETSFRRLNDGGIVFCIDLDDGKFTRY